ncbi:MAG: NADH-quinone oxidoreductase subunit NuoK [Candidatus Sumerlaea chitinivorans]|nr:NADH-quinone oxidoreductase subunit NuoK [Candidatus Sumerlaea chitinivorans]
MIGANVALIVAAIIFCLGAVGVIARRNLIFVLMAVEIMLNAAGLAFVAASAIHGQPDGQVFFIFILPVAAAEVAIGLALAVVIRQRYGTLDLWKIATMSEEQK